MRLTRYTDYAMRVLLYLGTRPDRLCSIAEIAGAYRISKDHLMKVVNDLAREGHVASVRGRFGGIRLGRPADQINVGAVIRHTEEGFDLAPFPAGKTAPAPSGSALVDCGRCVIAPACGLADVLNEALAAFLAVLDRYTLDDLLARRLDIGALFADRTPS